MLPGVNGSMPEYKVNGTIGWTFRDLTVQVQSRFQDSYGGQRDRSGELA